MDKYIIPILLLICVTGCKSDEIPEKDFLFAVQQQQTIREFDTGFELTERIDLESELNIYSVRKIIETENEIIIPQHRHFLVTFLDKKSLDLKKVISLKKGRGPGEIEHLMDIDVNNDLLVITDPSQAKIVVTNYEAEVLKEISITQSGPHRVAFDDEQKIHALFNYTFKDSMIFGKFNIEGELEKIYQPIINELNKAPLVSDGELKHHKNAIFFLGLNEPIIKKYNSENELEFSRKTIDNFNTAENYFTIESANHKGYGLSPAALFSTNDFDVKNGNIFVLPNSNGDPEKKYVDVYNNDGNYLKSFALQNRASRINVLDDENTVLTIESIDGSMYLCKYKYSKDMK
ncbi:MAG: hypothetical protein WD016_10990 [Balneolaceae bacterium]